MSDPALLSGLTIAVDAGSRPLRIAGRWLADLGAHVSMFGGGQGGVGPLADADEAWLGTLSPLGTDAAVDALLTRRARRPAQIRCRTAVTLSGSGVRAHEPSAELSEAEICAAGGIAVAIGRPDRDPLALPDGAMDSLTGAHVAGACLAALLDGVSETEVAAADVATWVVAQNIRIYEPYGARWLRAGRRANGSGGCYPYSLFDAADGQFCLIGRTTEQWRVLASMAGAGSALEDPVMSDPRVIARRCPDAADALLAPWLGRHTRQELRDQLIANRFAGGPVHTCEEVLALDSLAEFWRATPGGPRTPGRPFAVTESVCDAGEPRRGRPRGTLRVLDLAWVWSGPAASVALGDLGADVVKVESALRPDNTRLRGPSDVRAPHPGAPALETSEYFQALNRGKRSVELDLSTDAGRATLQRLAADADVIIENLSPGVMERWGIAPARVLETNPGCTFVSMRGFGAHPSTRNLRAYAPVLTSAAGIEALIHYPGEAPVGAMTVGFSDALAASHAVLLSLAGVHSVRHRGRGAAITLSQFEGSVVANGRNLIDAQLGGARPAEPLTGRLDYLMSGEGIVAGTAPSPWVSHDLFETIAPPWLEPMRVSSLPWRRDGALPAVRGPAPELGADTEHVLGQLAEAALREK